MQPAGSKIHKSALACSTSLTIRRENPLLDDLLTCLLRPDTRTSLARLCSHQQLRDKQTHSVILFGRLQLLRYSARPPPGLGVSELLKYKNDMESPLRTRILTHLQTWVTAVYTDFANDKEVMEQLRALLRLAENTSMTKIASQIEGVIEAKEQEARMLREKDVVLAKDQQPFWTPMTFTPTDLSQQLSLIEWDLLRRVEPRELLSRAWLQPNRDIKAPNLMKLIHRTNTTYRWVINELTNSKDKKVQEKLYGHFLKVAAECHKLNNINTAVAITQGLSQFKTRAGEQLSLPAKNVSALRTLRTALNLDAGGKCPFTSPAAPYIANFLQDLIQKGDLPGERRQGAALFAACTEIGAVIRDLMAATAKRYNFEAIRSLQKFLYLENIPMTRDFLIDLELQLENPPSGIGRESPGEADALTRVVLRSREVRTALNYIISVEQSYGVVILTDGARRALQAVANNENGIVSSGSADSLRSAESEFDNESPVSSGAGRRAGFTLPVPPNGAAMLPAGLMPLTPTSQGRTPGGPGSPQLPVEVQGQPKRSGNRSPNNSSKQLVRSNSGGNQREKTAIAMPAVPSPSNSGRDQKSQPTPPRQRTPEELRREWHSVLQSAGVPSERMAVIADVLVFELIEPSQLSLLDPALLQSLGIMESDSKRIIAWHEGRKP